MAKIVNEIFKLLRTTEELTIAELSEKIGLSAAHISEIENKKKEPSWNTIEKYCEFFHLKMSTFMFLVEDFDETKPFSQKLFKILERIKEMEG